MTSGIPFIKIADRVEVTVNLHEQYVMFLFLVASFFLLHELDSFFSSTWFVSCTRSVLVLLPVPLPMRLSVLPAVTLLSTSGSLPLEDDKVLPATMASTKVSKVFGPVSAWKGLNRRGSA